jgi:hypothetical protein
MCAVDIIESGTFIYILLFGFRSLKFAMRKFVPFSESAIVRFNCTENYKSFFCYILSKIVKLSLLNRFVDQLAYWLRNVFKKIQGI